MSATEYQIDHDTGRKISPWGIDHDRSHPETAGPPVARPPLRIEATSDAQLRYIRGLCDEYGWQHPDAVASKAEASTIIGAMRDGSYRASDWEWHADGVPF